MGLIHQNFLDILPWCVKLEIAAEVSSPLRAMMDHERKIDLGHPKALSLYNSAVAKIIANLSIDVPPGFLIPTICLRHAYLIILMDELLQPKSRILEIGTGASAVLSLLSAKLYDHTVVATEVNETSYQSALQNIETNKMSNKIDLRKSEGAIITGMISEQEQFDALICYPPLYPINDVAMVSSGKSRGFGGQISEMIGGGREGFSFTDKLLREAVKSEIRIVSVMLTKVDHVGSAIQILEAATYRVYSLTLKAGTRTRYLVVGNR